MSSPTPASKPSLKVPRENNSFLCLPAASESKRLLERNQLLFADSRLPAWFQNLRRLARQQALDAAREYMVAYAPELVETISSELEKKAWVVGGHQPELFHPGVWFKNFLMSEISQQADAVGFQIIIDHDVARSDTLRVPCGANSTSAVGTVLSQRSIPLPIRAEWSPRMPWHATRTASSDSTAWNATIDNVTRSMKECGLAPPLLESRRSLLADCIASTNNIGDAFSQFRHRIELDHGVRNLEVPIGRLCDETAFGLFVHHCVTNADSLWTAYNECRNAYRERHKIRNQGQPVLELQKADGWLELPFWIYQRSGDSVVRQRLWVSQQADRYVLSDSHDPSNRTLLVELPRDVLDLPASWLDLVNEGVCVRPRALMTTMYLRCFVGDLFVHGIGGGTYDELTDDIVLRWMGISPPTYLISSASLYLPFAAHREIGLFDPSSQWASVQRELHLMRSVPERYLKQDNELHRQLYQSHAEQLANIPARGSKLRWHHQTVEIKHRIELAIESQKQSLLARLESMQLELQQRKILISREYSFVLFDEQDVVGRLIKLAQKAYSRSTDAGK